MRDYKYTQEIAQMVSGRTVSQRLGLKTAVRQMFVFGEVQDPQSETVNLVEDIVRSQIIELVSGLAIIRSICSDESADPTSTRACESPRSEVCLR